MKSKRHPLMALPELDSHEYYKPPNPDDNAFDGQPPMRDSDYYCLARRKWKNGPHEGKWGYCYLRAGHGTLHTGYGRCKHHGGGGEAQGMRYAALTNPTIAEKIAQYYDDPDPLDLRPELAAGRALFAHFVEEYQEITEALLAWHASFDKKRRNLHDKPLYHIDAVMHALIELDGKPPKDLEQLQQALEVGLEKAYALRRADYIDRGKEFAEDLMVEKPVKVKDIAYAATLLKVINQLVDAIIKHEKEAHLSVFAYDTLMEAYGKTTRKHVVRYLKRMGVTDDEGIEKLLRGIVAEWERTPAIESSVPRLAAEQRERDEYLRA